MKKLIALLLSLMFVFTLGACDIKKDDEVDCTLYPQEEVCIDDDDEQKDIEEYIDIYYLNDMHGALVEDDYQLGISYIANLVNTEKAENEDNVLFLAGGDMLQGSALSNYYDGASTIELLNLSHLDAFTVGNHEFDWGLETVLNYRDGNEENGEADFPFLGANIFYDGTENIPDGIDPYTIIEKGTHKVGIIGTMGLGLENSIAESKIAGYEFASPTEIIEDYAHYLRTEEDCDVIIVMSHDSGGYIAEDIQNLDGDYNVDIFLNAHSHSAYVKGDSSYVQMQSGANGEYVGYIHIDFNESGQLSMTARNLDASDNSLLTSKDPVVSNQLEAYILETNDLFNSEIIVSGEKLTSSTLSEWISRVMVESTDAVIAFQNYGGTRASIENGDMITFAKLYQVFPFDNVVKTAQLTGREVKALMNQSGLAYYTDVTSFDNDTLYVVATNDYVYDKTYNPFVSADGQVNTGLLMRDLALLEMELQSTLYNEFRMSNTTLINPVKIESSDTITTN